MIAWCRIGPARARVDARRGRADRARRRAGDSASGDHAFPGSMTRSDASAGVPAGPVRAPTIAARRRGPVVPAIADAEGLQVLRRQDHARLRAGRVRRRRPERLGQVERRRLRRVGARRAGRARVARRQDGRRHLRRHRRPARARSGRGRRSRSTTPRGMLPIEFSEVTITRTLFRTGESEYMINGVPCRLLDIQELLSDTGIGRQQHVIVGQGQLDAVLNARPEDRRAIIEEAAGILKFRKRTREGAAPARGDRRQPAAPHRSPARGPAPAAAARTPGRRRPAPRRHRRRAARDHAAPRRPRDRSAARRVSSGGSTPAASSRSEEQDVRVQLRALDDAVIEAERALAVPGGDDVADLLARTEALRERSRGLTNLVAERRRGLERELAAVADEGVVETLVAEAARTSRAAARGRRRRRVARAAARRRRGGRSARGAAPRRPTSGRSPPASCPRLAPAARPRPSSPTRNATSSSRRRVPARSRVDLAQVRAELAEVDAERATIEPSRAEADDVERAGRELRAEVDAQLGDLAGAHRRVASAARRRRSRAARRRGVARRRRPRRRGGAHAPRRSRSRSPTHAVGGRRRPALDGMIGRLVRPHRDRRRAPRSRWPPRSARRCRRSWSTATPPLAPRSRA